MLPDAAPPTLPMERDRARIRNILGLLTSEDVRTCGLRSILLHHPERLPHGFRYGDWLFDGDDLVAVSRTAIDDAEGGGRNFCAGPRPTRQDVDRSAS